MSSLNTFWITFLYKEALSTPKGRVDLAGQLDEINILEKYLQEPGKEKFRQIGPSERQLLLLSL
jgi:hypothetical protein